MKVYAMNVTAINPCDDKWYRYLSDKRIEKVSRLKQPIKKAQSIGAELLLNYAVNGDIKIPVRWDTDENGKLYLTDSDSRYVNLSHSGDYAVCAAADTPVGVDVQYCREYDIKTAERFFTAAEADAIKRGDCDFFDIWTKKESLVKAVGCALTVPLNSFSVLDSTISYGGRVWQFKEYTLRDSRYKLFSCFSL